MKLLSTVLAVSLAALLASCGGGGADAGSNPFNPNPATPGAAQPANLILTLSQSSVQNSSTTPVEAVVIASAANGQTLANVPVTFSVTGGQFTVPATTTDANGQAKASIILSNDKSNRVVSVQVTATGTSGTLTASKNIVVSGVKISGTATPSIVTPGQSGSIEFTVSDATSAPINDLPVTVSSPWQTQSGTTNSTNGKYTYNYTVPSSYSSSEFIVSLTAGGVTQRQTVAVQLGSGSVVIPPAASAVATSVVEADPAVVGTNPVGSPATQTATIRFKAFAANSLPIANVRVAFDLAGDAGGVGGSFSSGSNVVYTDSNGIATTTYVPGPTSTATNGLTIRACYSGTDFTPNPAGNATVGTAACPSAQTQQMTINNEALNVTIGPNDEIEETDDGLRYKSKFVVQVVNASGQAKENVLITPSLDLLGFQKGSWSRAPSDTEWRRTVTSVGTYVDPNISSITYPGCANEDTNRNGIKDVGEDRDGDNVLEPRKSDVAISFVDPSKTRTDATGAVALQITYLKNTASWARIKISVKGAVSGTEGVGTYETELAVPHEAVTAEATPAFATNPYGAAASCTAH